MGKLWVIMSVLGFASIGRAAGGFACSSNPCFNGVCIEDITGNYSCYCIDGYTGFFCETNWNECWSNPCLNGGTCTDGIAEFNCTCPHGFQGTFCEEATNECMSSPCQNNGTCIDKNNGFSCICHVGYTGELCEQDVSVCNLTDASDRCENGGLCVEGPGLTFSCLCQPGWKGEKCQLEVDECASLPCKNGAICVDQLANYTCSCPSGFTGRDCEFELKICEEDSNCENGALCLVEGPEPLNICYCVPDFHGDHCQFQYDECQLDPKPKCKNGGICIDGVDSYTCTCPPDLTGKHCECLIEEDSLNCSYIRPSTTSTTQVPTEVPTTDTTFAETETAEETSTTKDYWPISESSTVGTTTFETTTTEEIVTTIEQTTERIPEESTLGELPCEKICLNGGFCSLTTEGPSCKCPSEWEGEQCESKKSFKTVAFSGQSYISHKLEENLTRIQFTLKTLSPNGLILYEDLGPRTYLALYVEDDLLKFKFSCGVQTMLLSGVQFHINNGFNTVININLDFLPKGFCHGAVRVNNSVAMTGEQVSKASNVPRAVLYLGGVPINLIDEAPITEGFVGCMSDLIVNENPKDIYSNISENINIKECVSLACLSSPCQNGGTCREEQHIWICACPSGFLGRNCEKSVCDNNPCEFGGTCTAFPGSGFICLCPYGKHGQFCESDLDIGQSCFSASIGGLSSFSAHPLPVDIHRNMKLSFRFIPHDLEQISLMTFIGQDGVHGPTSDHLAVSFIKGYILLTWNLGSGSRRIFTTSPIKHKGHQIHQLHVGRIGQDAWLSVDDLQNVTGKSPGQLTQLNTRPILYLGGHESRNFSRLPHDLPLHTGFSGCIFDSKLQISQTVILLQQTKQITGRGVGQCGTSLCHEHACLNGGGCIHQGATFSCICMDGWFGPNCASKFNPCDNDQHNCTNGATCVPTSESYVCDCPLGRTGKFCENFQELSDVSLRGVRSYLAISASGLEESNSCLELEVRPISSSGLVLYMGTEDKKGAFLSLYLQGGVLELRLSVGKFLRRGEALTVRSRRLLALGQWHRIKTTRHGRRLFLWVEGAVNSGLLLPGENLPSFSLIYIGGAPDLSQIPEAAVAGHIVSFQGCVRKFISNSKRIPLNTSTIIEARNIEDCDGTSCGGDICENGGSCHLGAKNQAYCSCPKEYEGSHCELLISCLEIPCENGGRCSTEDTNPRCFCPTGWGGPFCEKNVTIETPHFSGDGYLILDRLQRVSHKSDALKTSLPIDFIYLNFTIAEPNGLLLWSETVSRDAYLGIGIDKGVLKFVWKWSSKRPIVVKGPQVGDGLWHDLGITLSRENITVWSDHQLIYTEKLVNSELNLETNGVYYLGGLPRKQDIRKVTQGHFKSMFLGCIQKLAWTAEKTFTNFSTFPGENVASCELP